MSGTRRLSIDEILSVNRAHGAGTSRSSYTYLITPTEKGYKIVIESDLPITKETFQLVFDEVQKRIDYPNDAAKK